VKMAAKLWRQPTDYVGQRMKSNSRGWISNMRHRDDGLNSFRLADSKDSCSPVPQFNRSYL
jgi:hypothetical protein